jgi:hypothetical protein
VFHVISFFISVSGGAERREQDRGDLRMTP